MMEPEPKEFDKLQKLLASKEKEKPEEGFFDRFSDQVLTRLEEPEPKPTLWERLNDQVDPLRTAAAIFATVIGLGVLFALDEGSNMTKKKPESLGQTDEETSPEPLGQGQNTLAGSGLLLNKSGAQPPRILMNPGTGLAPLPSKIDSSFYQYKSTSNTVHTPK